MTRLAKHLEMWSPPCPICAGESFERLASNDRYGMRLKTVGCQNCGLVQCWPRPTPVAMDWFYRNEYRRYYQSVEAPSSAYLSQFGNVERLTYTAHRIQDSVSLSPGMRVLDVGCAEGTLFVELARLCPGLVLVGIEPLETFAAFARANSGCATYESIEAMAEVEQVKFDLVIVNHVLEHASNPVSLLRSVAGVTAKNAKLYVDVPDVSRNSSPESLHIAHLFHFSKPTLAAAAGAAGLNVDSMDAHSPPNHPESIVAILSPRLVPNSGEARPHALAGMRQGWPQVREANRMMRAYLLRRMAHRWTWLVRLVKTFRRVRVRVG